MTALCFVAIVILGLFSLSKLPVDLYPDIETNSLMVLTTYSGASASDIENNVTRPLENTLNSVEHLKHITSKSSENISVITLEFEFGYDIDVLTNDVRDKLDMVSSSLPDDANTPIIFKFSTDMIPILMLSVTAEESQNALYKILDDNVVNPLARIDGVGTVSIAGAPKREINIYMDPAKMEAFNIPVETISNVIAAENRNIPGGNMDIGSNTYSLRVEGEFNTPQEMLNLVVGSHNGANVYLRDVARIVDSRQERSQQAFNNGKEGAMIIVQKQSGANSVEISNKVMAALPKLQKSLPSDVKLGIIVNTSDNIMQTVNSLAETIMYALIFVVVVVFAFLGRWRATVIIAITIPFSLIASFIYLFGTGGSLNIISLSCLSIAIGSVVDDSIVVLENVTTHIERGASPKHAAIHGTNEVAISVIASTLTMLAVFFPLTMISGMTGVMFKELGWMMCIIMIVSTVAALSLTPMLCSQMLKLEKKQSKLHHILYDPFLNMLNKLDVLYARLINWCVRHRKSVMTISLLVFVASMVMVPSLKTEFFPSDDNGRITGTLYMPMNTNTERSREMASELSELWMERYKDEMLVCNYRVGAADEDNTFAAMQSNGTHIISFNITLVDFDKREKTISDIVTEMRADLTARPEVERFMLSTGGGGMGGQSSAQFEIYGYDLDETDRIANEFMAKMKNVKGVGEAYVSREKYQPEYQVEFDRDKLAQNGLNLTTAATFMRNRVYGSTASYYREDGEEYNIRVRYAPEFRTDLEDIENILLYGSSGKSVRVKDVGRVVERFTPPSIERKDRQRVNTVTCVVSGDAVLSEVVDAGKAAIKELDLPDGVTIQIAGDYEEQQESFADLGMLALLIILLVFIVMAAQFESLSLPFIIMFSVPFAISGVLLALGITGTSLNVMSFMGAIMLIGIVVKNGIVLVDYTGLCRERGQSAIQATVAAAKSRLRPVLMTTLTTILGMIPMAVSQGQGAAMWRPLGISVIGGLTISTFMTLLVVPVLYCMFNAVSLKRQRRKHRARLQLLEYWAENKDQYIKK